MSNDSKDYPEDSVENMQIIAREMHFPFPYLLDANQQIAKNYGAVCTPDFFGFNNKSQLQYRGRFDESRKQTASQSTRDLFHAMKLIAETGQGPREQISSIGCSIKWLVWFLKYITNTTPSPFKGEGIKPKAKHDRN